MAGGFYRGGWSDFFSDGGGAFRGCGWGLPLIAALRRRFPEARFLGVGGELMAAAGCRLLENPVKRSAMLVGALVTESRYWWKLLRRIRAELERERPAVVIPIDSSFINMRIAKVAKGLGIPVCYYGGAAGNGHRGRGG